jgi:hypothetical protein
MSDMGMFRKLSTVNRTGGHAIEFFDPRRR